MRRLIVAIVWCALSAPGLAMTQHQDHAPGADAVGSASVSFETSCAPALKLDVNRAVALLHSFWFAEAIKTFNGVLRRIRPARSRIGGSP